MKSYYDLSVDLVIFDLGLPLNVKSMSQTFQEVVSHNGTSYDRSLYEIHIASHIWHFNIPGHFSFATFYTYFSSVARSLLFQGSPGN